MNWDAIGAVGEVAGAAAVVVSLVYLAMQIRHATTAANASAHHQYLLTQSSVNHSITDNADVCELIDRANKDVSSLTDPELLRLQFVMYEHFNQWQFAYATGQKSILEKDIWESYARGYTQVASEMPALQEMWRLCGSAYDPEFRAHVDEAILRGPTS